MYRGLAEQYDNTYASKDYAGESATVAALVRSHYPQARTLLDVACGTGRHLVHLQSEFQCEGADASEEMLRVARARLPGMRLHLADMTRLQMNRTFDAVTCLFSSVGHLWTVESLNMAVHRISEHLAPKGVLVIEPWATPENWMNGHISVGAVNSEEFERDRIALAAPVDRGQLVMEHLAGAQMRVGRLRGRHEMAWFTHREYITAFELADLEVEHDPVGLTGRGLYVGTQNGRSSTR
jgi:SAM-dependent methyltransferase